MTRSSYDVCVIGSGVAGSLVAYALGKAGVSVVMLEAGRRVEPDLAPQRTQLFVEGTNVWRLSHDEADGFLNGGSVSYPLNDLRFKLVGGTTMGWEGYTPRFLERDFDLHTVRGVGVDWPISYSEIEPYYVRAEREIGVAGIENNPFASYRSAPFPLPGFPVGYDERLLLEAGAELGVTFHNIPQAKNTQAYRGRPACTTYSVCQVCPIGARYSADVHVRLAEETGHVQLIDNATVVRLETTRGGDRVVAAVFRRSVDSPEEAVRARVFVVAAHAVESARLLLLSDSTSHPQGLGNHSGLVGRNFMERRAQFRRARFSRSLFPYRKGFETIVSQQFHDHPRRDEGSGFNLRGHAAGPTITDLVQDAARRSGIWGDAFARELQARIESEYGREMIIGSAAEPLPSEENRIELAPERKDRFGNPVPRVVYEPSAFEEVGHARADVLVQELASSMGADELGEPERFFEAHQAGTCRMGEDPDTSVVDPSLRIHGLENTYVVGSANFCTLSISNPTLTIAALALRLGDHLLSPRAAVDHSGVSGQSPGRG